ncbi:MAG TPA: endo-1,4-beta-xylanase [Gemmataceae bacterium]|nr:endo-1,4-beta-xylanase [Gemmataceae bacterium]
MQRSLAGLTAAAGVFTGSRALAGSSPPLRDLADANNIWIGPAVAYNPLLAEPIYADTLQREFNILTPENAMKWAAVHPQQDRYTFSQADAIFNFGVDNGMAIHGHNLIWQSYNPNWLTSGSFSRDEMIAIMADHINTVAGRYAGSIAAWDVVNEALDGNGNLASGIWRNGLGPDYVDLAFQFARDADPNALLVYNDYSAEVINAKSNGIYTMVQSMQDRGIPIDGVGFQMHIGTGGINYSSFAQNLQRFADLGLAVFVTEMDVRIQLPVTPENLDLQATVYRNVLDVCLNQPACYGFQMWGFTDAYSWIPGFFPGYGAALIFDENYQPKPAYNALIKRLMG